MATRLNFASVDFSELFEHLIGRKRESGSDVRDAVAAIIADIRGHGDDALLALTAKYDGLAVGSVGELLELLVVDDEERRRVISKLFLSIF